MILEIAAKIGLMRFKWTLFSVVILLVGIAVWFNWNSDSAVEEDESEEVWEDKPARKIETRKLPDIGFPEKKPEPKAQPRAEIKQEQPKLDNSMKELEQGMQALMEQGINMLYGPLYDELGLSERQRKEMTKELQDQAGKSIELAMMLTNDKVSSDEILAKQAEQKTKKRESLERILGNARSVEAAERFDKGLPMKQANMQADLESMAYKKDLSPEAYKRFRDASVQINLQHRPPTIEEMTKDNAKGIRQFYQDPSAIIRIEREKARASDQAAKDAGASPEVVAKVGTEREAFLQGLESMMQGGK